MGGRSSRPAPPPDRSAEIAAQAAALARLQTQLDDMTARYQSLLGQDKGDYEKLRARIADLNIIFEETCRNIVLGPKGSGKSTFLWMKGLVIKPENDCIDNGTKNIADADKFIDTVGVNIEMELMLKWIAVLLATKKEIPGSLVLVLPNARADRSLRVLQYFGIANIYLVILKIERIYSYAGAATRFAYDDNDSNSFYNISSYDALKAKFPSVIPILRDTPFDDNLHSLRGLQQDIFKGNAVSLPEWNEYKDLRDNGNIHLAIRYHLCKRIVQFIDDYGRDEVQFLDSVN